MADITPLINRYFVQTADISQPGQIIAGERVPATSQGNRVQYLIDPDAYFSAINQEIARLLAGGTNRYFYVANWWLGIVPGPEVITVGPGSITSAWTADADAGGLPPFDIDAGISGPAPTLITQLGQLAAAGVDVRALTWISPLVSTYEEAAKKSEGTKSIWVVNTHTLLSARALRGVAGMADKVVLNTLAHPLGAMHLKMVISGDNTTMRAFVSGLDFVANRLGDPSHAGVKNWHDAGVRVEGPAATGIYDYYRLLWNEQLDQSTETFRVSGNEIVTYTDNTIPVPSRTAPALAAPGTQHVQVLRTAPQMNFSFGGSQTVPLDCFKRLMTGFRKDELSFAPEGIFEFRPALRKAISGADRYIYIEDQAFKALEVMEWINARLRSTPALKVIMVYGADPADPPNDVLGEAMDRLIAGVATPANRVVFCNRGAGIVVHTKITIIDDIWTAIGSANCMRRSLYTDGETSVGVLDEATPAFAHLLRRDLWGEHCGLSSAASAPLLDLNAALGIWNPAWGAPPAGVALRPEIRRMRIPFEYAAAPAPGQWPGTKPVFDQLSYDRSDADSRQEI